jgi:hypothetical protein
MAFCTGPCHDGGYELCQDGTVKAHKVPDRFLPSRLWPRCNGSRQKPVTCSACGKPTDQVGKTCRACTPIKILRLHPVQPPESQAGHGWDLVAPARHFNGTGCWARLADSSWDIVLPVQVEQHGESWTASYAGMRRTCLPPDPSAAPRVPGGAGRPAPNALLATPPPVIAMPKYTVILITSVEAKSPGEAAQQAFRDLQSGAVFSVYENAKVELTETGKLGEFTDDGEPAE